MVKEEDIVDLEYMKIYDTACTNMGQRIVLPLKWYHDDDVFRGTLETNEYTFDIVVRGFRQPNQPVELGMEGWKMYKYECDVPLDLLDPDGSSFIRGLEAELRNDKKLKNEGGESFRDIILSHPWTPIGETDSRKIYDAWRIALIAKLPEEIRNLIASPILRAELCKLHPDYKENPIDSTGDKVRETVNTLV